MTDYEVLQVALTRLDAIENRFPFVVKAACRCEREHYGLTWRCQQTHKVG